MTGSRLEATRPCGRVEAQSTLSEGPAGVWERYRVSEGGGFKGQGTLSVARPRPDVRTMTRRTAQP